MPLPPPSFPAASLSPPPCTHKIASTVLSHPPPPSTTFLQVLHLNVSTSCSFSPWMCSSSPTDHFTPLAGGSLEVLIIRYQQFRLGRSHVIWHGVRRDGKRVPNCRVIPLENSVIPPRSGYLRGVNAVREGLVYCEGVGG